jgi:diguanylate cyclase
VRNSIAGKSLKNKDTGETMGKVTMSIGVSSYRQGDNAHKLIFRADQALYEAKRLGRNRCEPESD